MNKDRRKQLNALQDRLQQTGLRDAMANLIAIRDELESIKDDEREAFDNLPESLQDSDREYPAEQLEEACETIADLIDGFDFDRLDEAFSNIEDAKGQA